MVSEEVKSTVSATSPQSPKANGGKGFSLKSMPKPVLGLGALVVVLIIAYFALSSSASSAADKYFKAIRNDNSSSELSSALYSLNSSDEDGLEDAKEEVKKAKDKLPKLDSVIAGATLSGKYKDAQEVEKGIDSVFDDVTALLDKTGDTFRLSGFARELSSQSYVSLSSPERLNSAASDIKDTVSELEDLSLKGNAADVRDSLVQIFDNLASLYESVAKIDPTDYSALSEQYTKRSDVLNAYRDLQEQMSDLTDEFQDDFEKIGKKAEKYQDMVLKNTEKMSYDFGDFETEFRNYVQTRQGNDLDVLYQ